MLPSGQLITATGFARADAYHTDDNSLTNALYRGEEGWQVRGIAAAAVDMSWPLVGSGFGGTQLITPRVQIVASPTLSNLSVPNEDARAVDLEDSNLFALNRFPGYDRFEDNVRITYGLDWQLDRRDLTIKANIGQSYRLSSRTSILPDGTGLSDRKSDVVGRVEVRWLDKVDVTTRFRLDKDDATLRRFETDATVGSRQTYGTVGYLRLNRDVNGSVEDLRDREEIRFGGRVQVSSYWSVFGSGIIDLTGVNEDPLTTTDGFTPIRTRLGVAYDDDCLSISITWRRDYQDTGDALQGDSILFRLSFRNLGV
jgi:LPS-assembly protein